MPPRDPLGHHVVPLEIPGEIPLERRRPRPTVLRTPPHAEDADAIGELWHLLLPSLPPPERQLLAVLPCEDGRPLAKVLCVVDNVPVDPSADDMRKAATFFAEGARQVPVGGVLAAIGRRGVGGVTDRDVRWVEPWAAACAQHGVDLLGVWLCVAGRRAVRLDAPSSTAVT